jgi:hypothetical protein
MCNRMKKSPYGLHMKVQHRVYQYQLQVREPTNVKYKCKNKLLCEK